MTRKTFPQLWAENYANPFEMVAVIQCAPDTDWDRDIFLAVLPTDSDGNYILPHSMRWAPFYRRWRVRYDDRNLMRDNAADLAERLHGRKIRDVRAEGRMVRGWKWPRIEKLLGPDTYAQYLRDLPEKTVRW